MLRTTLVTLATCSLLLNGCGTFSDALCGPINDHVYYRGVRLDLEAANEGGPMVLMVADIPFSAVADTLLVPYLAYRERTNPPRQRLDLVPEERATGDPHRADPLPQVNPTGR